MINKDNELTPIEKHGNVFYKRDDFYKPFTWAEVNGGKVRQCLRLLEVNRDIIIRDYNSTVSTATSVHSPQGAIVAACATKLGLKSIIAIGTRLYSGEAVYKHKTLRLAKEYGGDVRVVSGMGFNSVLYSRLHTMNADGELNYIVKFGMNLEKDPDIIVGSISDQVQNIPKYINTLIVPTGSGITGGGILAGLLKYDVHIDNIYLVQISGYNRISDIHVAIDNSLGNMKYVVYQKDFYSQSGYKVEIHAKKIGLDGKKYDRVLTYNFVVDKRYEYSHKIRYQFDGKYMDEIYEAKAYDWMLESMGSENGMSKEDSILYWVVGNGYYLRNDK